MAARKEAILEEIARNDGFKTVACKTLGVPFTTFYRWMDDDPEFKRAVENAVAACGDYRDDVSEKKLFELVKDGDTAATIFYNKTKNRRRGYTEKPLPPEEVEQQAASLPQASKKMIQKINNRKAYFIKLLKRQGKYTPELAVQVKMTAELCVRTEMIADEIFGEGHKAVNIEISREGNIRERISEKERLYLDYMAKMQSALKAIGMNVDSKERKSDGGDSFDEFMAQFTREGDDG